MSVNKVNSDGSLSRVAGGTLYADTPIGTISPFGGSTIPSGYLLCNGAEVLKTAYEELYAVIGDAFGTASDNTKFVLPDLREAVPKGAGLTGKTVGNHLDADGLAVGEFLDDRMQDYFAGGDLPTYIGGESEVVNLGGGDYGYYVGNQRRELTATRRGATTEVKAVGVNYIIKAKQVAVPFDMAEYIRNQNVLSDYENITLPTSEANAMTMPYDGVYILANYGVESNHHIYLNNVEISAGITGNVSTGATTSSTVPFKKGDTMYRLNTYTSSLLLEHVAYYKLRDYSGR